MDALKVIILVVVGGLVIYWVIKEMWDDKIVSTKCDWCGKEIISTRWAKKRSIKHGVRSYCSGRCRRADEASEGVKEKRIRWIDHE